MTEFIFETLFTKNFEFTTLTLVWNGEIVMITNIVILFID
jgi:hypothetical protein